MLKKDTRLHHNARGTDYLVEGSVMIQCAGQIRDDDELVLYKNAGGRYFARPLEEVEDGRFEIKEALPEDGTVFEFNGKLFSRRELENRLATAIDLVKRFGKALHDEQMRTGNVHPEIGCTSFELSQLFDDHMTFFASVGEEA